ncbi:uncharacterized protein LOC130993326 [Salvia miltiorrhiza]|uniref:uncharacterized protein LOC130993326 n=1 Tax=Salvia miltiorrhiza TaxID=226208 RepID=UPI0025AC600E|nr:uncharacterized protein LOC130993326 [Salvia miltiorrhiza]
MGLVCANQISKDHCQEISTAFERVALRNVDVNTMGHGPQPPKPTKKRLHLGSSSFHSPNTQRGICTRLQLWSQEKQIGIFALHKDPGEENQILFQYKDIHLTRHDMMSLRRGVPVSPSVITAWGIILNRHDYTRSEKIPACFYASPEIYIDCIAPVDQSYEEKKQSFFLSMTHELREYQSKPISIIDLFFFPVYENDMHYVMCFDTRKQRLFVLDSTVDPNNPDSADRYNESSHVLRSLFSEYLWLITEEEKAAVVSNSVLEIVRMKWADARNEVDTGVYLMRHLETFMGDNSLNWDCNLSNTSLMTLSVTLPTKPQRFLCKKHCLLFVRFPSTTTPASLGSNYIGWQNGWGICWRRPIEFKEPTLLRAF